MEIILAAVAVVFAWRIARLESELKSLRDAFRSCSQVDRKLLAELQARFDAREES